MEDSLQVGPEKVEIALGTLGVDVLEGDVGAGGADHIRDVGGAGKTAGEGGKEVRRIGQSLVAQTHKTSGGECGMQDP